MKYRIKIMKYFKSLIIDFYSHDNWDYFFIYSPVVLWSLFAFVGFGALCYMTYLLF